MGIFFLDIELADSAFRLYACVRFGDMLVMRPVSILREMPSPGIRPQLL